MNEFTKCSFELPTRIEFGRGVSSSAGEEAVKLGAQHLLLVTDKGVEEAGLLEPIIRALDERNINYVIYDAVQPNPKDEEIMEAADFAREHKIDGLIAFGGGSVMDSAKAIGTLLTHGGHILDWCGVALLKKRILPLIAIPTTAGTGSEVTCFAVVTNTRKHIKESIWDIKAAASVALLDPDLLMGLPASIMASTGADALTHAVESFTCRSATCYSDVFALRAISLITEHLKDAVKHPNPENCSAMMLGSNLAGFAIGYGDVAAVHCIAEALGGRYDIPHGVANAMLLPTVTQFNYSANISRYAVVARMMNQELWNVGEEEAAAQCGILLGDLCESIGINKMKDFNVIKPEDFPEIAVTAYENTSNESNPVKMTPETYLELIKKAYEV